MAGLGAGRLSQIGAFGLLSPVGKKTGPGAGVKRAVRSSGWVVQEVAAAECVGGWAAWKVEVRLISRPSGSDGRRGGDERVAGGAGCGIWLGTQACFSNLYFEVVCLSYVVSHLDIRSLFLHSQSLNACNVADLGLSLRK